MSFKRARSDDQRQERRQAILETASSMLAEMPVSDLSFNELSRRVGLAKSALLIYFESREAVLLELLDGEMRAWIDALGTLPTYAEAPIEERISDLAAGISREFVARPVLCDLIAAQAGVLERNVTAEIILRHKRSNVEVLTAVTDIICRHVPELGPSEAGKVFAYLLLVAGAAWPHANPTVALQRAFDADPEVAALHMDFEAAVKDIVGLTISGLLASR